MPLLLKPAVEADLEHIVDIQFEAFAPSPFSQLMFLCGVTPEAKLLAVERSRRDFDDPVIKYVKVVDTDLDNKAVAFAKWHIYREERPESEWMKAETRDYGEGSNREVIDEFWGQITEKRRTHLGGQPHCRMKKYFQRMASQLLLMTSLQCLVCFVLIQTISREVQEANC